MESAVFYTRVSTDSQKERKTIEYQDALAKELITNNQHFLVHEYKDEGFTGETLDREQLDKMREGARAGSFKNLYVFDLDRISRTMEEQIFVVKELMKNGIDIYTHKGKLDSNEDGKKILYITAIVAEMEKMNTLARTREAKRQKARRNVVVGHKTSTGYDYKKDWNPVTNEYVRDGRYEPNGKWKKIVNIIFDTYLDLRSIRGVTKYMQDNGYPTPMGGARWGKTTIKNILTRTDYIGTMFYNKHYSIETKSGQDRKYKKVVRTGRRLRDRKEWIGIDVPPIVDEKKYKLVQDILAKNSTNKRRNDKYKYLLTEVDKFCLLCGCRINKTPYHGVSYYKCDNKGHRFPLPRDCFAGAVKSETIDDYVWSKTADIILNPDILLAKVKDTISNHNRTLGSIDNEKSILLKEKSDLCKQSKAIVDCLTKIKDWDENAIKDLQEKLNSFYKRLRIIDEELSVLEAHHNEQSVDGCLSKKSIKDFCKLAVNSMKKFSFEDKQKFVKMILSKVDIDTVSKKIKVKIMIPSLNDNSSLLLRT